MWTVFLALRYFRRRGRESMISLIGLISVIGIALGVASLVVVLSVMNGFNEEVRDKIIGTYSHIVVTAHGGVDPRSDELRQVFTENEDVIAWAPFVSGQAVFQSGDQTKGVLVKGIDPVLEAHVTQLAEYADEPELLSPGRLFLGRELMGYARLGKGDKARLIFPYSTFDVARKELEVVGAFATGRYDYDANMAIVHLDDARELFRTEGKVTGFGLRITDAMEARTVKRALMERLSFEYDLRSWMEMDENLVRALALEKRMMFIILTLIITIACFNIAASLIMMVMEKTRDIGILKALGASNGAVSRIFLFEAVLCGTMGVLLGSAAGYYLASNVNETLAWIERVLGVALFPSDVYYFTELPVSIVHSDLITIASVAMGLAILAGLYPARRAARLEPVEAIRYE